LAGPAWTQGRSRLSRAQRYRRRDLETDLHAFVRRPPSLPRTMEIRRLLPTEGYPNDERVVDVVDGCHGCPACVSDGVRVGLPRMGAALPELYPAATQSAGGCDWPSSHLQSSVVGTGRRFRLGRVSYRGGVARHGILVAVHLSMTRPGGRATATRVREHGTAATGRCNLAWLRSADLTTAGVMGRLTPSKLLPLPRSARWCVWYPTTLRRASHVPV
jgi:hypothetical protein